MVKMRNLIFKSFSLFILALSFFTFALEAKDEVKYVQAGGCKKGNGSKKHPFNTLAEAEADTSWKTLVVLPSPFVLDGGITLRSGTNLIGAACNSASGALSVDQPTITNSSGATNGGNGVVVRGNAKIKNIYIKDTWASGIRYDEAKNLEVKNVLITGYNQGNVLSQVNRPIAEFYEVAGIHGQLKKDGTTTLEQVIIRNNNTGSGVIDQPYQGAQRQLIVKDCEFAELKTINVRTDIIIASFAGLLPVAIDVGTKYQVCVIHSYFHDFEPPALQSRQYQGILPVALNGAHQKIAVSDSSFFNIYADSQQAATHILSLADANPTEVAASVRSKLGVNINHCHFEEPLVNTTKQVTAFQLNVTNSNADFSIENCVITNVFDNIVTILLGDGTLKGSIIGNHCSGFEAFFAALTELSSHSVPNPQRFEDILIEKNTFVGGENAGAILVAPNFNGISSPWVNLTINVKKNCFDGLGTGFAAFFGFSGASGGAGNNANIIAHKNSITNFGFDILDLGANVNYYAQKNWWGEGFPCYTGADCTSRQTCHNGSCIGPFRVFNLGTGVVDVSNPLTAPPRFCRCFLKLLPPPTVSLEAANRQAVLDNPEQMIENFKGSKSFESSL
jgi:hypothetical protein